VESKKFILAEMCVAIPRNTEQGDYLTLLWRDDGHCVISSVDFQVSINQSVIALVLVRPDSCAICIYTL